MCAPNPDHHADHDEDSLHIVIVNKTSPLNILPIAQVKLNHPRSGMMEQITTDPLGVWDFLSRHFIQLPCSCNSMLTVENRKSPPIPVRDALPPYEDAVTSITPHWILVNYL